MKKAFVVTDSIYGALVFTTLNGALKYLFKGKSVLESNEGIAFDTHISDVLHKIKHGMQVSGDSPELGSFTLTETISINRNEQMNEYGIVVKEWEI